MGNERRDANRTKVRTVICPQCKDEIYSRARHDFHCCVCGAVFVDGGFDYLRYGGTDSRFGDIKTGEAEVEATRAELYDDWNRGLDRFGHVKKIISGVS